MMAGPHMHTILYAEDDHDDLFMVQQAFENFNARVNLVHANNGYEALDFLKQAEARDSLPCLIILDINMPGMDGKETLIHIKKSEVYKDIPVILFTTSSADGDRAFAKKWGAEFNTKPLVFTELEKLAHAFLDHCKTSS